ncbi:hypothetical protein D3C85_1223100 [compost metagenome]
MDKNEIEMTDFRSGRRDFIHLPIASSGHGGGDEGIMKDFVRLVQNEGRQKGLTSSDVSVQSHVMAFAAEKSKLENRVIDMKAYMTELSGKQQTE